MIGIVQFLGKAFAVLALACIVDGVVGHAELPLLQGNGLFVNSALADDDDDDDDDGPRFSPRGPSFRSSPPRARQARPRPGPRAAARALTREWVAAGVTEAELAQLRGAGFTVIAERRLDLVPAITARLRAPRRLSDRRAEERLRTLIPAAILDRNHLYRTSARPCRADACFPYVGKSSPLTGSCAARGVIGMIDTGVDTDHPLLAGLPVETEAIHGPNHRSSRSSHGTEIAVLIAGAGSRAPDFSLLAINAFHRRSGGDAADAFDIAAAIDRLAARSVAVANLSFAGPSNALLERVGAEAEKRGMIVVAAAGNDGPSSPPRYPAAYDWAIAVTAVDRRENVYPRAVRGPHIAFAAPGVRIQLPDESLRPGPVRSGTSYAAPLVTVMLSARRASLRAEPQPNLVTALASEVKDLGVPGRDPVFGWGLVVADRVCPAN